MIIRSKVTKKILNYFFLNPQARHYINELAKILSLDPKNVDRKLKELEAQGLLKSEFSGKQRYFWLNSDFPLLSEYGQIVLKTYGLEESLARLMQTDEDIEAAYIFGSYVSEGMDKFSDIDLLIVGRQSSLAVYKKLELIQSDSGRDINVVNLTPAEFERKQKNGDALIKNIFSHKVIKLK
jgi:predicted nucleotidyltransferase